MKVFHSFLVLVLLFQETSLESLSHFVYFWDLYYRLWFMIYAVVESILYKVQCFDRGCFCEMYTSLIKKDISEVFQLI